MSKFYNASFEKNWSFELKQSTYSIIYGTFTNMLDPEIYDKRFFYEESISGKGIKIKPIYDQARLILWKRYMPKTEKKLDSIIKYPTLMEINDPPTFGKLLEIYYLKYSQLRKKITVTSELKLPLDKVVYFDSVPVIDFNANTLFVPIQFNHGMYDFIVVAGKSSEFVRVLFIQFTIQKGYNLRMTDLNKKFAKFYNEPSKITMKPIDSWLNAFVRQRTRNYKFYEIIFHYYQSIPDDNFNMCSFGKPFQVGEETMFAFERLCSFL